MRSLRNQYLKRVDDEDEFDQHLAQRYGTVTEGITDGIDITDWKVKEITFSIWDFAGQTVYYNTHQVGSVAQCENKILKQYRFYTFNRLYGLVDKSVRLSYSWSCCA